MGSVSTAFRRGWGLEGRSGSSYEMSADPPHVSHDGRRAEAAVSVASDVDTGVVEITVRGRWTRQLGIEVYAALRDCLAEHPSAVIVDLRELNDLDAVSAS